MRTNDDGKFCLHVLDSHDIVYYDTINTRYLEFIRTGIEIKNYKDENIVIEIENYK